MISFYCLNVQVGFPGLILCDVHVPHTHNYMHITILVLSVGHKVTNRFIEACFENYGRFSK